MDPGVLFRLLLRRPRPILRLDLRLDVAPHVPLYARGLTASERAIVADAAEHERETLLLWLTIVEQSGVPVFDTPEQTHALMDHETDALVVATADALRIVSPSYNTCDRKAWGEALTKGAADGLSYSLRKQIAAAGDYNAAFKQPFRPRPDRYFGVALADITDAQHMAFEAAFYSVHK